jgi:drug/metabolite transporter (DMT)-like permease
MRKLTDFAKLILLDILGVSMLIGAALIGWLPGPGGIPLAIGGLALLAINHTWAERWLKHFKKKGLEIKDKFNKRSSK